MRTLCIFLLTIASVTWQAYAGQDGDAWGPVTNNVQMAINLKDGQTEITNGQPCGLFIRFKNLWPAKPIEILQLLLRETDPTYSFDVIDPSGNDISPVRSRLMHGSQTLIEVPPGETRSTEFKLSAVCKLGKNGNYRVIAKKFIWFSDQQKWVQVVSNPLIVTVVPSQ